MHHQAWGLKIRLTKHPLMARGWPAGRNYAFGLKIRLTRRPLTTMDFTSCMPSAMRAIFSLARAAATTSSSLLSVGTMMLARTLPPT